MGRSVLEERLGEVDAALQAALAGLDPDGVPAADAPELYALVDRISRSATAARTVLARRVADSQEWRRRGFRTVEDYLAATAGIGLGAAKAELQASSQLQALSDTRRQMLEGTVSPTQGHVIAGAAAANPDAEAQLLSAAETVNVQQLREQAARARAAADPDPEATHARLHRQRRVTRHRDAEGALHLHATGTADEAAVVLTELDRLADEIFRERRAAGVREGRDAYVWDALVRMAQRSRDGHGDTARRSNPRFLGLLRVDVEALRRGAVEGAELCEISGVGPVPVRVAQDLLSEATLKVIITRGVDVLNVTSLGRGPTAAMRYALAWMHPTCSVQGCSRTIVEHDHIWGAEFKDTRHTRLGETKPLCAGHHELHTLYGWALVPGPGDQRLVPPEDPRHPAHHATGPPDRASTPGLARPPGPAQGGAGPPEAPGPPADAQPLTDALRDAARDAHRARCAQQGLFGDPGAA